MDKIITFLTAGLMACLMTACIGQEVREQEAGGRQETGKPEGRIPSLVYEVFVQSFCDSDGDGIGDLNGLRQKLGYIQDLGADAIWLMPVSPSPSYHKYDVTDYRAIHPDYGTLEDFRALVSEAHSRNIMILPDLVLNHSSELHPWFVEAKNGPDNPYRSWYVWDDPDSVAREIALRAKHFDTDHLHQWHSLEGEAAYYYGFFWKGMPDLNYAHPPVREAAYAIGRYWLDTIGVDGFRLDGAKYIYREHRMAETRQFWEEFKAEMQKVKPDVYLVGEVWANSDVTASFLDGLSAVFNFELSFAIQKALKAEYDSVGIATLCRRIQEAYSEVNPGFSDAIFLTNHDQNRIRTVAGGDLRKARLAASILLTLPGTVYLYYGEEIGMLGQKPDEEIREPFLWELKPQDDCRTSWREPVHNTDATISPLSQQLEDPNSLYSHYRKWIRFRKAHPVLGAGRIRDMESSDPEVLQYVVRDEQEDLLVVHNLSGKEQTIMLPPGGGRGKKEFRKILLKSAEGAGLKGDQVRLPAYGSVVVK
jgi:glycosidase